MIEDEKKHYRFTIDVFNIDSLPMARLAEYMIELAKLLGERELVHFSHLERRSTVLVSTIEPPALPKVADRMAALREGRGSIDAKDAFKSLDAMLAKDNEIGWLTPPEGAEIISFPGRMRPKPIQYGPFREHGSVDGVIIRVGGRDESVPVSLKDGDRILLCEIVQTLA